MKCLFPVKALVLLGLSAFNILPALADAPVSGIAMNVTSRLALIVFLFIVSNCAFAELNSVISPHQNKVVFSKILSRKKTLIVIEKEVPYISPPEVKALGPNIHIGIPDHVYLYTFQLKDGQQTKILWSRKGNFFADAPFSTEPAMKTLDAITSKDKLCVVYKQGGITFANVITPGAPLDKPGIGWGDSVLIRDDDMKQISVASATLAGSLGGDDLSVDLKNYDATHFRYHLTNNKWIKQNVLPIPVSSASDASRKK